MPILSEALGSYGYIKTGCYLSQQVYHNKSADHGSFKTINGSWWRNNMNKEFFRGTQTNKQIKISKR